MKVLVFGSRGYLGSKCVRALDAIASTADIAERGQVSLALDEHCPDVVINCAGKSGHPNIDWCESHREETYRSNVLGPRVLCEECVQRKIAFVHISTGCQFSGDANGPGFGETDPPNFFGSYYVQTKQEAERQLANFPALILRLRMLFDGSSHQRNTLVKLAGYARLLTEQNSFTSVDDFVDVVKRLLPMGATGIFHVVNPGQLSPYEVMREYQRIVNPAHVFERLESRQLPEVARTGRSNCILSVAKLGRWGVNIRPVSVAIEEALRKMSAESVKPK